MFKDLMPLGSQLLVPQQLEKENVHELLFCAIIRTNEVELTKIGNF